MLSDDELRKLGREIEADIKSGLLEASLGLGVVGAMARELLELREKVQRLREERHRMFTTERQDLVELVDLRAFKAECIQRLVALNKQTIEEERERCAKIAEETPHPEGNGECSGSFCNHCAEPDCLDCADCCNCGYEIAGRIRGGGDVE